MAQHLVPAAPGTQAVYHVTGGKAVLRDIVAWRIPDTSGEARPVTLVRENALPADPEQKPVIRAYVHPGGRVVLTDGSWAWPTIQDYCKAKLLITVDS